MRLKIAKIRLKMAKMSPNQFVTSWKKQGLIFQLATKKKTPKNIQNHFFLAPDEAQDGPKKLQPICHQLEKTGLDFPAGDKKKEPQCPR